MLRAIRGWGRLNFTIVNHLFFIDVMYILQNKTCFKNFWDKLNTNLRLHLTHQHSYLKLCRHFSWPPTIYIQ